MRELTHFELLSVTGAATASELGNNLGAAIGSVVDASIAIFGKTTNYMYGFGLLGRGIGYLVELNFTDGFKNMVDGIIGIINAGPKK